MCFLVWLGGSSRVEAVSVHSAPGYVVRNPRPTRGREGSGLFAPPDTYFNVSTHFCIFAFVSFPSRFICGCVLLSFSCPISSRIVVSRSFTLYLSTFSFSFAFARLFSLSYRLPFLVCALSWFVSFPEVLMFCGAVDPSFASPTCALSMVLPSLAGPFTKSKSLDNLFCSLLDPG